MRFVAPLLLLAAATLSPLPGIAALPDGSQVMVARDDLQSFIGIGTVMDLKLTLEAQASRLPGNERVVVWFVLPARGEAPKFSFPGRVTPDGNDVNLEVPERVSLKKVLKDAYRIDLKIGAKK
jgi:hypothetical protein